MTNLVRTGLAIGGLALAALIVWAMRAGGAGAALDWLLGEPWGIVTTVDLYLGFAISAAIIVMFERNKLLGLAIALPVFVLGNVVTAAWAAWRLGELARRVR